MSSAPSVSRGSGAALFATALGIAIALFGLVFNNLFQDKVEEISSNLKAIILKATSAGFVPNAVTREPPHMVKPAMVSSA